MATKEAEECEQEEQELLNKSDMDEMLEAFDLFDKNGDKQISLSELKSVLRALGQNPTEKEVQDIMATVDKDDNALLDFEEYSSLIRKYLKPVTQVEAELKLAIGVFDKDGNRKLNKKELAMVLTHVGDRLTEAEADELCGLFGDGEVDIDDFVRFMCKRY